MEPSRRLNALVAEKVMGQPAMYPLNRSIPLYSTDIAAAWEVIIKMRELNFGFTISDNANRYTGHIDCRFWRLNDDMRRGIAIKDEAPLAICLAALKTLGVEVEDETGQGT